MLPAELTIDAILDQARQVSDWLTGLISRMEAEGWRQLWTQTPTEIKVVVGVILVMSVMKMARRWLRAVQR